MALPSTIDLLTPTAEETGDAREIGRALKEEPESVAISVVISEGGVERTIKLSESDHPLLMEILAALAKGKPVVVLPADKELSTQQAADLLNVSRPYLIGLLEKNEIPYRTVGTWRRVKLTDVLEYKARSDARSRAALKELVDQAQELDLGY